MKRVDDAEPVIEHDPVLHIFGPKRVAIGAQRGGSDHGIVDLQCVALRGASPVSWMSMVRDCTGSTPRVMGRNAPVANDIAISFILAR